MWGKCNSGPDLVGGRDTMGRGGGGCNLGVYPLARRTGTQAHRSLFNCRRTAVGDKKRQLRFRLNEATRCV